MLFMYTDMCVSIDISDLMLCKWTSALNIYSDCGLSWLGQAIFGSVYCIYHSVTVMIPKQMEL